MQALFEIGAGMKLVAVACSRSVPVSVEMAKAPADPCPYSGE